MPDEPVMIEAIEAMKRYHEAQTAGAQKTQVGELRDEA